MIKHYGFAVFVSEQLNGMADYLEEMRIWQSKLAKLPPIPSKIIADHSVPWGEQYRYWATNGQLWLYCNRDEIMNLKKVKVNGYEHPFYSITHFGIPIYWA